MLSFVRLLLPCLPLLLTLSMQTYACSSGNEQKTRFDSNDKHKFGAYVDLLAKVASGACNAYRTEIKSDESLSGEEYDRAIVAAQGQDQIAHHEPFDTFARASGSADYPGFRLTSSNYTSYDVSTSYHSGAELRKTETFYITRSASDLDDTLKIPYLFCSQYKSTIQGARHARRNFVKMFFTEISGTASVNSRQGSSGTHKESMQNGATLSITHPTRTSGNFQCFSGEIEVVTQAVEFTASMYSFMQGTNDGKQTSGSIDSSFHIIPALLFSGVKCYSASGSFPGCARKIPPKEKMCLASGGNPINFARGIKYQTEQDYSNGLLSFSRMYRSDDDYHSAEIGAHWHHNFNRKATVISSHLSTTVDVSDSTGVKTIFRQEDDGTWRTTQDNDTSTFENHIKNSTHIGYLFTSENETKEYYDLDGNLLHIATLGGEALSLTYNSANQLDSITNEQGKTLIFSYGSNNKISGMTTPDGDYLYDYDASDNLTQVTKPDLTTRTYHYEDTNFPHALTGITNEKDIRYATFAYDEEGRAIRSEHINGADQFDIAYNDDDSVTTTNALGKETTYHFENFYGARKITRIEGHESANCAAANQETTYDNLGFVKTKTDWNGNLTSYVRDERGLVLSKTESADAPEERITTYTYHPEFRLVDVMTEDGRITDYDYDDHGRTTSMAITDTTRNETRTTHYSYYPNTQDANGNIVLGKLHTIDGTREDVSDITTYNYNDAGYLTKTTNALGHATEITERDASGRVISSRNENDVETIRTYDAQGRLRLHIEGNNTWPLKAVTDYRYNADGQLFQVKFPNGSYLRHYYYDDGRIRVSRDQDNGTWYFYDASGNITKEIVKKVYPDSGSLATFENDQSFDELSRLMEATNGVGDAIHYGYDVNSNQTSMTDGNNNTTLFDFDGLNRLTSQTDALNSITDYDQNALDHSKAVTDPRGNATTYTTNAFGDILTEISPDRGLITYTYDKAGNLRTRLDARGEIITYDYDALNRVTSVTYSSDATLAQTYLYDNCAYGIGRLCSVSDQSGTSTYTYDALGRLVTVTKIRGALELITRYAYDLAGVLTKITYPSGRMIDYNLNRNARVDGLSMQQGEFITNLATNIKYTAHGAIEFLTYGNGIALTNSYNKAFQLTRKHITGVNDQSYGYDGAGNILTQGQSSFGYDDLYHLTDENSSAGLFSYSHDPIGNRLTKTENNTLTNYFYPQESSKLDTVNASPFLYDAAGNITQDAQRSYTINAAGQIKSISINNVEVASYIYDSNNLRTQKTVNGETIYYVYGQGGKILGEYDDTGAAIREYIYLNHEPLAQIDQGEVISYLHTDHLGTPRQATDTNGLLVWTWSSDAFGNGAPTGTTTVNLRFAGQYYDAESKLHYNWNRYYDLQTGRYITSDPIGLDGGLNTYTYVQANPVMHIDPEGLATLSDYIFSEEKEAAIHAIKTAWTDPRVSLNELAGIIYQKDGCFAYDYRFLSGHTGKLIPNPNIEGEFSAGWHTHPIIFKPSIGVVTTEEEYFSKKDFTWVKSLKKPLYLGTPKGFIKILTPLSRDRFDDKKIHSKY